MDKRLTLTHSRSVALFPTANKENDPECEADFNKAYLKLVQKMQRD